MGKVKALEVAQKVKGKEKKPRKVLFEDEASVDSGKVKVAKKPKKRKHQLSASEGHENDSSETVEVKKNPFAALKAAPATDYVPGALSASLGLAPQSSKKSRTETDSDSDSTPTGADADKPWLNATTVIQAKNMDEYLELDEEESSQTAAPIPETSEPKDVEEDGKEKRDRKQQRENRKKKTPEKMTDEESLRTIFVGNVDKDTDDKQIKKLFSKYGVVESVRIRNVIPAKKSVDKKVAKIGNLLSKHQRTVNAYVKFKDIASVEKAVVENGAEHWGHKLRVDTCNSKKYDYSKTIFLGNVAMNADEDSLAKTFEGLVGGVEFVRLVRNPSNGACKGIGFVGFKDSASIPLALQLPEITYKKRVLRVTKLLKKKQLATMQAKAQLNKGKKKKQQPQEKQPKHGDAVDEEGDPKSIRLSLPSGGSVKIKSQFYHKGVKETKKIPLHEVKMKQHIRKVRERKRNAGKPKSLMT